MNKGLPVLLTMTILTGVVLSSSIVSADNDGVVDEINITVPVSCTLSGTGMNSHNATINNGQYNSAIGETMLQAFCNDTNGFAIYAIGYTDDTDGKNVLTSVGLGSFFDIATGTATSGNTSNWAMKLSTVTSPTPTYPIIIAGSTDDTEKEQGDPDYTSFQEVPDDYERIAYRTAGTDIGNGAEGSTLKTTYQTYISPTQPAGTYTGQVKYTMVHPYNATAPVACRPNGTTIGTNTLTDILCMQDISSSNKTAILTSMTEEQQYTLKDKRDNKIYTVAKLKDGSIWMTQNLDLDLDSTRTYTNEDTDLGWNTSTNSYDTASWTPEKSTYTTGDTTWGVGGNVVATSWGGVEIIQYTPESYDPGDLYWNGTLGTSSGWMSYLNSCTYNMDTALYENCDESLNPISTYTTISGDPIPHYHFGNYYNFAAAVAMNDISNYISNDYDLNRSICPSGWTLPKSGDNNTSSGSFHYMFKRYGWDEDTYEMDNNRKIYQAPMYLGYYGEWTGGYSFIGVVGYYNSPIVGNYNYRFVSDVDSYGRVGASDGFYDSNGFSLRCITR